MSRARDFTEPPSASDTIPPPPPAGSQDLLPGDRETLSSASGGALAREDEADLIEEARDLSGTHLRGLLEALIFASDKPMGAGELARMASAPLKDVRMLLGELKETYAHRGIVLDEVAGGWLFRTDAQFAPFVRELASERPVKLTRAQLETLALVAYRQPVTRPEIDEIRGVDSGATLKLLLERELLRILGKKDEPGRPLLYGTTTHFLEFFGLKSLKDLPTLREFTELSDESRRVAETELADVLGEARTTPRAATVEDRPPATPPWPESARSHDTEIPSAPPTGDLDEDPLDVPRTPDDV